MYRHSKSKGLAIIAATLLLTACPSDVAVTIAANSTAGDLTFEVTGADGGAEELSMFLVESCEATYGGCRYVLAIRAEHLPFAGRTIAVW